MVKGYTVSHNQQWVPTLPSIYVSITVTTLTSGNLRRRCLGRGSCPWQLAGSTLRTWSGVFCSDRRVPSLCSQHVNGGQLVSMVTTVYACAFKQRGWGSRHQLCINTKSRKRRKTIQGDAYKQLHFIGRCEREVRTADACV